MSNVKFNVLLTEILNTLRKKGIDSKMYIQIIENFSHFLECPSYDVLEMLTYIVSFKENPFYVNEIRNYLKIHSEQLFLEYGNRFITSPGCFEVFGIQSQNISVPSFREEVKEEMIKTKEYSDAKNKKKKNNSLKKASKQAAAEKFKKNLRNRREKQKHREEIERLIRKQDL